jgi:hypothetical protein
MRRRVAYMLALIALGEAGCGGMADRVTGAPSHGEGQIAGTVRMIGGPAPGRRLLRHTGIDVYAGTRVVASMMTDAHGRFRLVLPPGRYRFTLGNGSELLPRHVDVAANDVDRLRLTLSVK